MHGSLFRRANEALQLITGDVGLIRREHKERVVKRIQQPGQVATASTKQTPTESDVSELEDRLALVDHFQSG